MAQCVNCDSHIEGDGQLYVLCDIGPEILSLLQERLGNDIKLDGGCICEQCFYDVIQGLSTLSDDEKPKIDIHDPLLFEDNAIQRTNDEKPKIGIHEPFLLKDNAIQRTNDEKPKIDIHEPFLLEDNAIQRTNDEKPKIDIHDPLIFEDNDIQRTNDEKPKIDIHDPLIFEDNDIQRTNDEKPKIDIHDPLIFEDKDIQRTNDEKSKIGIHEPFLLEDNAIQRTNDEKPKIDIHDPLLFDDNAIQRTNDEKPKIDIHDPLLFEDNAIQRNECVYCRRLLNQRRTHSLPEGPQRNFILERIHPRLIPDGGRLCFDCWIYSCKHSKKDPRAQTDSTPRKSRDINNTCVWCRSSLSHRRTHSLPNGAERDEIASQITPRQISAGAIVCYACWYRARRWVQRRNIPIPDAMNEIENVVPSQQPVHLRDVCAWCSSSLLRRRSHIVPDGLERDEISLSIYPRQLPDRALVCTGFWTRAQQSVVQSQEGVQNVAAVPVTMTFQGYRHTTNTSSRCFVPGCTNTERLCVPEYLRKNILRSQKLFIMPNARVCGEHKWTYDWDFLEQHVFSATFNQEELESMLKLSVQEVSNVYLDFERVEQIDDDYLKYWTGINKHEFHALLDTMNPCFLENNIKCPKTTLGIHLMKVRTGDSYDRIASLLRISKATVCRHLKNARLALSTFVPLQ